MASDFNIADLSTWTTALWEDRKTENHNITYRIARRAVLMDFYTTCELSLGDAGWKKLLDDGFLKTLCKLLCEGYICGFSKDEMFEGCDDSDEEYFQERILPYVIDILALINEALVFVRRFCDHSDHQTPRKTNMGRAQCDKCKTGKASAEVIAVEFTPFLKRVWEVRHPLLTYFVDFQGAHVYPTDTHDCEGPGCRTCLQFSVGQILPQCYEKFSVTAGIFAEDEILHGQFAECIWHSAFIMYEVWMNSFDIPTRGWTLMDLSAALDASVPFIGNMPYMTLFRTVTQGDKRLEEDVYMNVITDLCQCRWDRNPTMFISLQKIVTQLRGGPQVDMRSSLQREMFGRSLAASRRQLCSTLSGPTSVKYDKELFDKQCVSVIGVYLTKVLGLGFSEIEDEKPLIPELWIYEIIPILGRALAAMAENEFAYRSFNEQFDRTVASIHELARMLRYYMRHPSDQTSSSWVASQPPPPSAQLFSRKSWQETLDALIKMRMSTHVTLKYVVSAWRQLGKELDRTLESSSAENWQLRGTFWRCAYAECMCSVFRASHPMKACLGCYAVAYCHVRCQKRDWENHRKECGKGSNSQHT